MSQCGTPALPWMRRFAQRDKPIRPGSLATLAAHVKDAAARILSASGNVPSPACVPSRVSSAKSENAALIRGPICVAAIVAAPSGDFPDSFPCAFPCAG
jgi:hypothetical protein